MKNTYLKIHDDGNALEISAKGSVSDIVDLIGYLIHEMSEKRGVPCQDIVLLIRQMIDFGDDLFEE